MEFTVFELTKAINNIQSPPTFLRDLGLFKPIYLKDKIANLEYENGSIQLVANSPHGSAGERLTRPNRVLRKLETLHFKVSDIILPSDFSGVREFGGMGYQTKEKEIVKRQALLKNALITTREHAMLGALAGQVKDKDNTILVDIYDFFGLTRQVHNIATSDSVNKRLDAVLTSLKKHIKSEVIKGWGVLASPEFMQELTTHKDIEKIYTQYQNGAILATHDTTVDFLHKKIKFYQYDTEFPNGNKIPENEAYIFPLGTQNTFAEFFSPAEYMSAVNTEALPFYSLITAIGGNPEKGHELEAETNPLPIITQPNLVATLKWT